MQRNILSFNIHKGFSFITSFQAHLWITDCLPRLTNSDLDFVRSNVIISQKVEAGVTLPVFAVLTGVVTDVVLVQGAELRAGGRQAMFLVSALEAGQNTLTKQILRPLLHAKANPQLVLPLEQLSALR